ncbi:MAG TPA: D-alanyl-D-alanine carboxypeptidase [Mycobacteriales bacterium]|nr:D-alanyl-D-alanine carboxypeptidase [Mycobacteriales bacterium]
MRRPRLSLFATAACLALAMAMVAAPSPARAGSHERSPALSRLAAKVAQAFHGSAARHVDYRMQVDGVGTISHHANTSSAPASNEKLLTTAALLFEAGPSFRYVTRVYGSAAVDPGGTLAGDLTLVGSGDPTLTHGDLAGIARQLHKQGLRRVTGSIVIDDSRYSHGTRAPGWKHDFLPEESGAVDAFSVDNDNWQSNKSFLADPTHANAGLWRKALRHVGIHVRGPIKVQPAPTGTRVLLTSHRSRPLSKIVNMTLRESINYYAEMMLREAGFHFTGRHGNRATGIAAVQRMAHRLSLPLGRFFDGSGLSYRDRETPGNFVAWLTKLPQLSAVYKTIYSGLPVSCRPNGTLKSRLCGPHVKGVVHAKTGTLDHISTLSGYTTTEGGRSVTFSILLSGIRNTATAIKHIDAAVAAVVRSRA